LRKAARSFNRKNKLKGNNAFIALGSNKGDRINYIKAAITGIRKDSNIKIVSCSSVYETKAFGKTNQPNFLNAVVEVNTSYGLLELFSFIKNLELDLGRTATEKWGQREIDLDILFFNHKIYADDNLCVPHYGIQDRDFVLIPLCEIAPGFVHPALNEKISDICKGIISKTLIRKTRYKLN
jgi:2-amino-4-hydroxy-6-hydroxymethyldihydropteridine diphosphokinase